MMERIHLVLSSLSECLLWGNTSYAPMLWLLCSVLAGLTDASHPVPSGVESNRGEAEQPGGRLYDGELPRH